MGVECSSVRVDRLLRPFLIISLVSGATAAFARPVPLTGDDLKKSLSGALIEMDTPLGTTIPVRFGTDGLVSGEAGELAPLLGSARDRGRWWIDGDRICSKWFRWFDAEPQCLSVQQDGTRLFWQEDNGKKGTATLVESPLDGTRETAVAKAEDTPPARQPSANAVATADAKKAPVETQARSPSPPPPQIMAAPLPLPVRAPPRIAAVHDTEDLAKEASVETASVSKEPMMRFGGAALLEASTRMGQTAARADEGETEIAASARSSTARKVPPKAETDVVALRSPAQPQPARSTPEERRGKASATQDAQPERPSSAKQMASQDMRAERDPWTSGSSIRSPGLYRVRGVARRDVLNVRKGPSETHRAVAAIPANGRRVEITGVCQGEWCPIRYGRAVGWVHSFYLSEEQRPLQNSASRVYLAQP